MRIRVVLVLVPLVLAGCATGPAASTSDPPASTPDPAALASGPRPVDIVRSGRPSAPPSDRPTIRWSGDRLVLTTYGSSSCPDVPETAAVTDAGLVLAMREYDVMCTADFAPYEVVLDPPSGLDRTRSTAVRLDHARGRDDVLRLGPAG